MGCIYIIKNTVNDKVYIGQTIHYAKLRLIQHKQAAKRGNSKFYKAMRDIGVDNFYVETLEEVDDNILDNKENYYIQKYNSIELGYNSVTNGDYQHKINRSKYIDKYLDQLVSDYKNGLSYVELSIKYNISMNYIHTVLGNNVGKRDDIKIEYTFEAKEVVMYDTDFNVERFFHSKKEAYTWLISNSKYNIDKRNTYSYIKRACGVGSIAYGHRWQLASDLVYEDKIFRTKFDKEAYIQGKTAYQPEGKQYYIVDGVLDSVIKDTNINKHYKSGSVQKDKEVNNKCGICGKKISKGAQFCKECYNKQRSLNRPDVYTLTQLVDSYSYEEIGRMYNVTGKAIRKWCDSLGIAVKVSSKDTGGVVCAELNLSFDTFRDAARYMVDNKYTSSSNLPDITYYIGKAKKSKKTYLGFNWL